MKIGEAIVFFLIVAIVSGGLIALVTNTRVQEKRQNEQKLMRYEECKKKGNDVEWCMMTIKPRLYE